MTFESVCGVSSATLMATRMVARCQAQQRSQTALDRRPLLLVSAPGDESKILPAILRGAIQTTLPCDVARPVAWLRPPLFRPDSAIGRARWLLPKKGQATLRCESRRPA